MPNFSTSPISVKCVESFKSIGVTTTENFSAVSNEQVIAAQYHLILFDKPVGTVIKFFANSIHVFLQEKRESLLYSLLQALQLF